MKGAVELPFAYYVGYVYQRPTDHKLTTDSVDGYFKVYARKPDKSSKGNSLTYRI